MQAEAPGAPPLASRVAGKCFAVICRDAPGASALRARLLDGHLSHVETHWRDYVTAGPMRAPGGEAIIGSLFLVLAPDIAAAERIMRDDPYVASGLYDSIDYFEFTNSIGLFVGGKIWESADALRARAAGGAT